MKFIKYVVLTFLLVLPYNALGQLANSEVDFIGRDRPAEEVYTYYDLRDRSTYIQVTNEEGDHQDSFPALCIHIQIFQQDKGCSELNFEDEITANDTVVYDMDNLVRNDGTPVPVNLDDDSYGFVAISSFDCGQRDDDTNGDPLIGNVRIIDDAGYEYRMNLISNRNDRDLLNGSDGSINQASANVIIPFNTLDGATHADIVGFLVDEDRLASGQTGPDDDYNIYNEESGITFSVFQVDENEERLSCDQKTFACGPDKVMNYGINDDYPASRGNNVLCEGASLNSGQTNGYISLENAFALSPLDAVSSPEEVGLEFICLIGLNNGDNTGSMDRCIFSCIDGPSNCVE